VLRGTRLGGARVPLQQAAHWHAVVCGVRAWVRRIVMKSEEEAFITRIGRSPIHIIPKVPKP
jgi:hypothetical protein